MSTGVLAAQHLVVGSGAGGALTAARLAEAGQDVLLVEEGPAVDQARWSRSRWSRWTASTGMRRVGGARPPVFAYAEGRCLGGGTEINSGLYHLAGDELLEEWRAAGRSLTSTTQRLPSTHVSPS